MCNILENTYFTTSWSFFKIVFKWWGVCTQNVETTVLDGEHWKPVIS